VDTRVKKINILTQRVNKLANGLKLSNRKINELQLEVARLKRQNNKKSLSLWNFLANKKIEVGLKIKQLLKE